MRTAGCEAAVKTARGRLAACADGPRVYDGLMKSKSWVAAGLVLAWVGSGWAQPAGSTDPKKAAPKTVPTALEKKDDKKKKEEAPGKIEGMEIGRGEGFLGIQLVKGSFKLTAYNAKKKPVAADFTRVGLRWQPANQKGPERTMLLPGGGVGVFTSERIVKPPLRFRLFITLIKGDGDDAPVENLTVEFQG